MRVPVPVVAANTDEGHSRSHRMEEGRVRGRRTVVWHRQEVGVETAKVTGEQVGLGSHLDVAGGEDAPTVVADPHHDRGVVELAARPAVRTAWRRVEDLDGHVPNHRELTRDRGADGHATVLRNLDHLGSLGEVRRERSVPDGADAEVAEDVRYAADMVEVRVGHDHQVEVAPTVAPEPRRRRLVLTGVDQDARPWGLDQEGVSLPDVDGGHRHGPLGYEPLQLREPRRERRDQRGSSEPAGGERTAIREDPQASGRQRDDGDRAARVGDPAEPLEPVGRGEDDVCRCTSQPEQRRPQLHVHQGEQ
jgi:hypothetical protein